MAIIAQLAQLRVLRLGLGLEVPRQAPSRLSRLGMLLGCPRSFLFGSASLRRRNCFITEVSRSLFQDLFLRGLDTYGKGRGRGLVLTTGFGSLTTQTSLLLDL